jgi:predicted aconitase with swiveling domain
MAMTKAMTSVITADVLIDGAAEGTVLKLGAPICFWGGVDPASGRISDPKHPDHGAIVTGRVLAIPRIVGSSSSSQLLLELMYLDKHPAAILLGEPDAILGIASLVAREMAFGMTPILHLPLEDLESGMQATIASGGQIALTKPL